MRMQKKLKWKRLPEENLKETERLLKNLGRRFTEIRKEAERVKIQELEKRITRDYS